MDQCRQLLLLPLHDLPRLARAERLSRAWNSIRRECCFACPAEDRGGIESSGARAGARQRLPTRFRTHARGLLPVAKHLFIQLRPGSQGHVSQVPGLFPLAREDGRITHSQEAASRTTTARADSACQRMGCITSAEILRPARVCIFCKASTATYSLEVARSWPRSSRIPSNDGALGCARASRSAPLRDLRCLLRTSCKTGTCISSTCRARSSTPGPCRTRPACPAISRNAGHCFTTGARQRRAF